MPSSTMSRRMALVRTDVSEECTFSIREKGISELGMLAVTDNSFAIRSSETSVLTEPHGVTS
jgi:hypothetical protein